MKRLLILVTLLSLVGGSGWAFGQDKSTQNTDRYLSHLPMDLKLKEDGPQQYRITCDYLNLDALGNLTNKERVTGLYTRALPGAKVKWSDVRIAQAKAFADVFPQGDLQKYMEGFTYTLSARAEMFQPAFFQGFPASEFKTKNLVWDMYMIEQFAWDYFNKLELNRAYALQSQPEDVSLAGGGTFQNRNIELTWIGVSKRNNETCAVIQYQAFFNKLKVAIENFSLEGRSHYWGEIWVSLTDKQIEHATLFEDVLMELSLPNQSNKQLVNVFRKAAFEKIEEKKL